MKRITIMVVFLILALVCAISTVFAAEYDLTNEQVAVTPIPTKRIAVVDLQIVGDGVTSDTRVWLQDLIRECLVGYDWTILARGQSYRNIRAEQNLAGIDPATKAEPNKLWGATALMELTARFEVNRISGGVAFNFGRTNVQVGSYVKCKVDIIGKITNVQTGEIQPITSAGNSSGAIESLGFYFRGSNAGGIIHNDNIRNSLAWKSAEKAVRELAEKWNSLYGHVPSQAPAPSANCSW